MKLLTPKSPCRTCPQDCDTTCEIYNKWLENSGLSIPYSDIDEEIVELCKALNDIDGIKTVESCCGHGKDKCFIWFIADDINILNRLCFHCFNHENLWKIELDMGDPHRDWKDLHLVLTSNRICGQDDFDNLADRINKRKSDIILSDKEWKNSELRCKNG